MSSIDKVKRWSRALQWLTVFAMIATPIAFWIGALNMPLDQAIVDGLVHGITVTRNVTAGQLYGAIALSVISPIIFLFVLNDMRRLFASYRTGDILTKACANLIKRIGQGFLGLALMQFILQPVMTALLTMHNPPGKRSIAVSLNSEMIFFALSGGLIIVIGWAMREASNVASENRSFV